MIGEKKRKGEKWAEKMKEKGAWEVEVVINVVVILVAFVLVADAEEQ